MVWYGDDIGFGDDVYSNIHSNSFSFGHLTPKLKFKLP